MIVEMAVPAAGESVTEATIGAILVPSGSWVKEDQAILELETDKANMPLNAIKSGKLEILVKEGDDVKVGQIIVRIDTSAPAPVGSTPDKKVDVAAPTKAPTKAATVEAVPLKVAAKGKSSVTEKFVKPATKATLEASPAATKISIENNVNLAHVTGTGKGGRITREDVINQIKNPQPAAMNFSGAFPPPPNMGYVSAVSEPITGERETRKKMSRLRRVIAKK